MSFMRAIVAHVEGTICSQVNLGQRSYPLSSDQVCSPHLHLNMRTVRPFREFSMVRTCAGFSPQSLHVRIGLGSKLEKTSFLNSLSMDSPPRRSAFH
jgi:hypothetical protein